MFIFGSILRYFIFIESFLCSYFTHHLIICHCLLYDGLDIFNSALFPPVCELSSRPWSKLFEIALFLRSTYIIVFSIVSYFDNIFIGILILMKFKKQVCCEGWWLCAVASHCLILPFFGNTLGRSQVKKAQQWHDIGIMATIYWEFHDLLFSFFDSIFHVA